MCTCNHAHANTALRRAAERCYAFGLPPGEEVKSSRSADCLNVLRRVYSSYQFPDKYLHFRTHISYFPLTPFRSFFFSSLARAPLLPRPRPAIVIDSISNVEIPFLFARAIFSPFWEWRNLIYRDVGITYDKNSRKFFLPRINCISKSFNIFHIKCIKYFFFIDASIKKK